MFTARKRGFALLFLTLWIGATLAGCVRIVPAQTSAKKDITGFLKRYSKKYPDSEVGKGKIKAVEIYQIEPVQRGVANVVAFLTLESGEITQAAFTLKTQPFGWVVDSWELLSR